MPFRLVSIAPLVLCTPLLLAQQADPSNGQPPQGPSPQGRAHHAPGAGRPGSQRMADERDQMRDERMDLDELGLPTGSFWLDPQAVSMLALTPDQVQRLTDAQLQGTLKLIQLDADLQTNQAKLDAMLGAVTIDANAAQAQIDRIADARAAVDKADARLAFALRAVLTPDQLMKLRTAASRHMQAPPDGFGDDRPTPPQM